MLEENVVSEISKSTPKVVKGKGGETMFSWLRALSGGDVDVKGSWVCKTVELLVEGGPHEDYWVC
jgi:hypothetical protein